MMAALRLISVAFFLCAMGCHAEHTLDPAQLEAQMKGVLLFLRNQQNGTGGGIPGMHIHDPMSIPDFTTPISQLSIDVTVVFRNMTISGLSNYTIDRISANLGRLEVSIGLNLTNITVKGLYSLNGTVGWFSANSKGAFRMNITDTYVWGTVKMQVTENGTLETTDVDLDCNVRKLQLHFEKLFGGGLMSGFANSIVNILSGTIFDNIKPTMLNEMSTTVKDMINIQLQTIPQVTALQWTSSPLDVVIANTVAEIRKLNLDPFVLPNPPTVKFQRNILFLKVYGEATLLKGYLTGLSSLHRTGDMIISFQNNTFEVSANLGFDTLEGGFRWHASAMGISRTGGLHFRVKNIILQLTLSQLNELGQPPRVKSFEIKKLGQIGLDVDGLGSLDFVVEFFANFVTNVFKTQLSHVLQTTIKTIMDEELAKEQRVRVPF